MDATSQAFVGIDVAKRSLDVCVLGEDQCFTIPNSAAGFRQLLGRLPHPGSCLVVIEATGGYQNRLVGALVSAAHRVAVVNPRQVRDFARGLGILAKTDRLDARVIARFGQHTDPRPVEIGSEKQAELRELVTRRRQLIELRTAEQNRLETIITKIVRKNVRHLVEQLDKQIHQLKRRSASSSRANRSSRARRRCWKACPG